MKKLLVLTRFPGEYEPRRLAAAARERGVAARIVNYEEVGLGWGTGKTEIFLPRSEKAEDFDGVVLRSGGHHKKESLSALKTALVKVWPQSAAVLNRESFEKWPIIGKTEQGVMLAREGTAVIPSWFLASREEKEAFLKTAEYPLIIKGRFGSHSQKTFRAEKNDEARQFLAQAGDFFIQKLVKSRFYWRVMVLGGKVLGAMKRETNDRLLAAGENWEISEGELGRLALAAAAVFKAQMAGVDILATGPEKGAVIEVNRSPQFEIFERRLGIRVAEEVIGFLTERQNGGQA